MILKEEVIERYEEPEVGDMNWLQSTIFLITFLFLVSLLLIITFPVFLIKIGVGIFVK